MTDDAFPDTLDSGLALALAPPPSPPELRAQVLAAIAREPAVDHERRRLQLIQDRRMALAKLNRLYLRRCRDALLTGSGLLVLVGLAIRPLSQGLAPLFAGAAPGVAGALALGSGLVLGVILARDLFARREAISLR